MNTAAALSQDECREIVSKHLQREDFELKSFAVSPLSAQIKGFMGDHLKLCISVSLGDQESRGVKTVELQFFVKSVPLDDAYRRNFALSTVAYQKEVLFYGDIVRAVRKHLRCADQQACTYLGTVPRCYYLRPDLLVLEDLTLAGFRMLNPVEPMTVAQCESVLQTLARFHAASLVFEEREGRRLADAYPLLLQETLFRKEPGFPLYDAHVACVQVAHALLDLIPRFAPGTLHSRRLHSVLDPAKEEIYEQLKPTDKYRIALCHKDLWANNIMFAVDAKGELLVRLMDFQTLHLEPPAHDVSIFLHFCMVRDMRQAYGRWLLEQYHRTLADVLRQHDLNVDSILPLPVFLQSYEESKRVAVVLAAYTLQVTMLPSQKGADLESFVSDRTGLVRDTFQRNERFRKRMTETMEELVDTCLMPRLRARQD